MIISHKYEGKNINLLLDESLKELNVSLNDVFYQVNESNTGLFKTKKYLLYVITKNEIIEFIKEYFNDFSNYIKIEINCEIKFKENVINILLVTNNNNIIIGSNGKTLNAIQLLLRQALIELNKYNLKILLDVSNYREKKAHHLEYEINMICKEVISTKVEVKLDPMNSYDRRIVHSIVSKYSELLSVSYGEEPERYTIIKYKD